MKRFATVSAPAILLVTLCFWPNVEAGSTGLAANSRLQTSSDPISPRIASLKKQIESGNGAALEEFWKEIVAQSAPLVEPIPGDDRKVFLTFLWRAKTETRNVLVAAGVGGGNITNNLMSRLLDTDLWYKTYRAPSDARFSYALSPNDSLVPLEDVAEKDIAKRVSTFGVDPLNKRTALGAGSMVELPGASPQPWGTRQPDVAKGRLDLVKIKSEILRNERRVWVYTPPGYVREGKPYGLMVMFDGPMYTLLIPTPVILENLLAKSKLPPMVAVILDNPTADSRNTEFACSEPFAEFIAGEVIPWIRSNYNVTTDPGQTVVSGVSFGGLASAFIGFRHPEIFGNVISQSGSFWWKPASEREPEWLTHQYAINKKLPLRFWLDVGLFEIGPTPGGGADMVTVSRHMRDILLAKGYEVTYRECNCGHDVLHWRGMLPEALMNLFGTPASPK